MLSEPVVPVVIVNADDFGRSPGINRGVLDAHDSGILTSASLMTLWPASAEAAAAAATRPELGVGLHFDVGEWAYADGSWECQYLRVSIEDEQAIATELDRQLRAFRRLLGRDPDHLDSHQHVHREGPARTVLRAAAEELGVPLRHFSDAIRYVGDFYGQTAFGKPNPQAVSVPGLLETLGGLEEGVSELACHPGYATDLVTTYRRERELEVRTLCDPRVRAVIAERGIELCSFSTLGAASLPLS